MCRRVRLRAVSQRLRVGGGEHRTAALDVIADELWFMVRPCGQTTRASGQPAHWSVWAAFEQAHADGKNQFESQWDAKLTIAGLSLQNWPAAARGLSS